jgi:membrane protease YdiL (CAAX protease family)
MAAELTGDGAGQADPSPAPRPDPASDWPGPVGRPARPHWWSAQPPPPLPRISARRAYAEVLGVYGLFFAASVIVGGEALDGRYPRPSGSWAVFAPGAVSQIAWTSLAVLVVLLMSARRGVTPRFLGLSWPRTSDGTPGAGQTTRILAWAVTALIVGGRITADLAGTNRLLQPAHQDYSYLLYSLAASLAAGVVEELVVLAFVVTTLRQAGRPLPEIVLVGLLLRCSYHDYYGFGVAGIAVWALVFIWLFLRTGSILPMLVLHVLWDGTIFVGQRWMLADNLAGVVIVVLVLVAVVSWIVNVISRRGGTRVRHDGAGGTAVNMMPPFTPD